MEWRTSMDLSMDQHFHRSIELQFPVCIGHSAGFKAQFCICVICPPTINRRPVGSEATTVYTDLSTGSAAPMTRLSMYSRERIRGLLRGGASVADIVDTLKSEGIVTCRQIVWRFKQHLDEHIEPLPKSGCPTKLTCPVLQSIETRCKGMTKLLCQK